MRRLVLIICVWLVSGFAPGAASALDFSADNLVQASGKTVKGKVYMTENRWRREMSVEGMRHVMIGRMDKKVMWMVMPEQQMYMEIPFRPDDAPKTDEKIDNEVSRKKIGTETIDGHPCDKYEITTKSDGPPEVIHQWIAKDIKFPIKTVWADGKKSVEYKNIKMGKPAASLFEVPKGYKKMGMSRMMPPQGAHPGGMPPGGMPEGMPKMPKMPPMTGD